MLRFDYEMNQNDNNEAQGVEDRPQIENENVSTRELLRIMMEQNRQRDEMLLNLLRRNDNAPNTPNQAQEPQNYHIMPDFSKTIPEFTGEGDNFKASEWLHTINSTATLHRWQDEFKLEAARSHMQGAARHWFSARYDSIHSWNDFEEHFRKTFLSGTSLPERFKQMQARVQRRGENVYLYFHEKVKLCYRLNLEFDDTKRQVLVGLWSKELCNHLMSIRHGDVDELLHDIQNFEEVDNERTSRISQGLGFQQQARKPILSKPSTSSDVWTSNPRKSSDESTSKPVTHENVPMETKPFTRQNNEDRKCYNCNRYGHISHDCLQPKRTLQCRYCRQEGHTERFCYKKNNLPLVASDSESSETPKTTMCVANYKPNNPLKYAKDATINGNHQLKALLDPGSSCCIIQASAAIQSGLKVEQGSKPALLFGFGDTENAAATALGKSSADISIDGVKGHNVEIFVVPDKAQSYQIIIGRSWTDLPHVVYMKMDDKLVIKNRDEVPFRDMVVECEEPIIKLVVADEQTVEANSVNFVRVSIGDDGPNTQNEPMVIPVINYGKEERVLKKGLGLDKVCLQIKEENNPVMRTGSLRNDPIVIDELNIDTDINAAQQGELLSVLNEFKHCFARDLTELGCTNTTTMDIVLKKDAEPLVVSKVLPGDTYHVCQLQRTGGRQYATTAHVSQLKGWGYRSSEDDGDPISENEVSEDTEDDDGSSEPERKPSRARKKNSRLSKRLCYVNKEQ